ncbi:RING-H2 finger protein ATL46-like [Chenopodium quinoa]|uniref:RING-H2 finger protein ATL46-like n=1 Tax=Chenopodium quinoa TaxID=63459 RepID=UPI000B791640|nr:RING-H2 finger protein ATL46-like [Chenopodium quinoa]
MSSFSSNLDTPPQTPPSLPPPPPSSSGGGKISPAILFIIIILAVIFFISGLLHLLVRFFVRQRSSSSSSYSQSNRYPENFSSSDAVQRQLQQLFQLHDSGLDQAFIDALPVFQYKEIVGLKEPFDCAVCLCEFTEQDKLRLLPLCSHAFHIDCIDTWLLSNSTCPLCRGALYTPGVVIENPVFDFDDSRDEEKGFEIEVSSDKRRVFPVRLGKFKSTSNNNHHSINNEEVVEVQDQLNVFERGKINDRNPNVGETSSSNLDARRCFSMGSYQYVVADSVFQVALCPKKSSNEGAEMKMIKGKNGNFTADHNIGDAEARKINIGSKTESLSVSKIWLWSKKGKFTNSSNTEFSGFSVDNMNLPWTHKGQAT